MLRSIIIVLTTLLLTVALVGCGNDDEVTAPVGNDQPDSTVGVPSELQGEWYLQSATINGITVPLNRLLAWSSEVERARLTIGVHNTCLYQELSALGEVLFSAEGAFTIEDSVFAMDADLPLLATGVWNVSDGVLTLTASTEAGYRLKVTAIREPVLMVSRPRSTALDKGGTN